MRDYLKCLMANRFCLAGCLMFSVGICLFIIIILELLTSNVRDFVDLANVLFIPYFLVILGSFLLGLTGFGTETYRAYKRAQAHINKYNNLNGFFSPVYCKKVGIKLAARELNID